MATIRASCADCGDVELTTADVTVRVCTGDNGGAYTFRCPNCRMIVVKQAESSTIDLLVASGVALSTWNPPAELLERRGGPPLSHDDLLDFHRSLHDDEEFRAALASLAA